ncbi:hypothetical protein GQ42DRAFT_162850 [Ramicandelaber brevisporus]|nr:hypothetical protein GQ42DRAFT_163941 [Ramicandelaber brevisporus]KAI8870268.1 hypothetical protein GQ42DRAFT_162850 [Ramicandelaber brevisporus]
MSFQYGNFEVFCKQSLVPVCRLLIQPYILSTGDGGSNNNGTINFSRECSVTPQLKGDGWLANVGDFAAATFSLLVVLFLLTRIGRKVAAVGRSEMMVLFTTYALALAVQAVAIGWQFKQQDANRWLAIIQIALSVALFWSLFVNGFVGFQWLADGSAASMSALILSSLAVFVLVGWIAAGTYFGKPDSLQPLANNPFQATALFSVLFIVPLALTALYLGSQVILVLTQLAVHFPLMYLIGSLVFFGLSQVFNFVISEKICKGTSGKVDGIMFSTLSGLIAMILLFMYWSSITEDDQPDVYDDY